MIKGWFDQDIPKVECVVTIPRLPENGQTAVAVVEFTVATGAAETRLSQADAGKLGLRPGHPERAVLTFDDEDDPRQYTLTGIPQAAEAPDDCEQPMPSVLGQDIFRHWVMTFDWPNQVFECQPAR